MVQGCLPEKYIPYQPGFEHLLNLRSFAVPCSHPLYGIVADFYQLEAIGPIDEICVIPDGCIDMVFRYDDKQVTKTLEGYYRQKVMIPVNQVSCAFGVRFAPGELHHITKLPAYELVGQQIKLNQLFPSDCLPDRMEEAYTFEARIAVISDYLLKLLPSRDASESVVSYCTRQIISHQGNIPISHLSRETGYTTRYLRSLYHHYVGVSPKELCEIIQFQTSFKRLDCLQRERTEYLLSDFAVSAGYYDQSHMNKSYQKLVGTGPKKFYMEVSPG